MIRLDGIVVNYDPIDKCGHILVVEDGDFENTIRLYEKNRLTNLDGNLLAFNYSHIVPKSRYIFRKIDDSKISRVVNGMKANFDIDGNSKKYNLIVRIHYHKEPFKIMPLFHFESKENDRLAKRISRVNQKVKHNLFKPWIIPFRN